jgi:hypothetical protein
MATIQKAIKELTDEILAVTMVIRANSQNYINIWMKHLSLLQPIIKGLARTV